jgi:hypothetical protein
MTYQEIEKAVLNTEGIGGMTVNERLYVSGLWNEFDEALKNDKNKAKFILELFKVDKASIIEILKNEKK